MQKQKINRRKRRKIIRKYVRIIGRSIFLHEMFGEPPAKVEYVVVDDRDVVLRLADGREISAPMNWYPRLLHATPAERNDWSLAMSGRAVMWNSLDFGMTALALLEGEQANELRAELKKWLAGYKRDRRKKLA
jgi:hypothetical protein